MNAGGRLTVQDASLESEGSDANGLNLYLASVLSILLSGDGSSALQEAADHIVRKQGESPAAMFDRMQKLFRLSGYDEQTQLEKMYNRTKFSIEGSKLVNTYLDPKSNPLPSGFAQHYEDLLTMNNIPRNTTGGARNVKDTLAMRLSLLDACWEKTSHLLVEPARVSAAAADPSGGNGTNENYCRYCKTRNPSHPLGSGKCPRCPRCSANGHFGTNCKVAEEEAKKITPSSKGLTNYFCKKCSAKPSDHFEYWCLKKTGASNARGSDHAKSGKLDTKGVGSGPAKLNVKAITEAGVSPEMSTLIKEMAVLKAKLEDLEGK